MAKKEQGGDKGTGASRDMTRGPGKAGPPENAGDEDDPSLDRAVKDLNKAAEKLEHIIEYYI